MSTPEPRAVVFDLGGVVFPSPIDELRAYEAERRLPHRFLSETILADPEHSAWGRMERGELTVEQFVPAFELECAARGYEVDAAAVMKRLGDGLAPRPEMLLAIGTIRARGQRTAALTNNWVEGGGRRGDGPLDGVFDVIVESARVGLRKPDPAIYRLVCDELGVEPPEVVFLDDLGANLKPARAMGMRTIKVTDPHDAIRELGQMLGFALDQ